MLKVAILDDYQNISQAFLNINKLNGKYNFTIFNKPFLDESDAKEQLKDFEVLLIMRERTKISKSLIDALTKLKFIIINLSQPHQIISVLNDHDANHYYFP